MSGGPCGSTPAAAIPSGIRAANVSKSSRDSQKSRIPQPPSTGPDEWQICVQAPELASQHEGQTVFPVCFRDAAELRSAAAEPEAGQ